MDKVVVSGYVMTKKQRNKLMKLLTEDILERYDNVEYWDEDVVEEFATENRLKRK